MSGFQYYPVFINLHGKKCIVIGGGSIAERKILSLLKAGADVSVISPELTKRLASESKNKRIKHIKRRYQKGDLKNAFIVIAATNDRAVNRKAAKEAPHLMNAVDMPALCNFIVPSVVKRGLLTIAISTSGASPAIAKAIRREIETLYGASFAKHLAALKKIRTKAVSEIKNPHARKKFLKKKASLALDAIYSSHGSS